MTEKKYKRVIKLANISKDKRKCAPSSVHWISDKHRKRLVFASFLFLFRIILLEDLYQTPRILILKKTAQFVVYSTLFSVRFLISVKILSLVFVNHI